MMLLVVALLSASRASALRLAGRDTSLDKGMGKIVHVKFDQKTNSVSIFGFELSDTRSGIEIASADEWKPMMFNLCQRDGLWNEDCHEITIPNSKTRRDKTRTGVQMPEQAFDEILPKLLEQVHVDIFHVSDESKWNFAKEVYDFGPVAPLEMGRILSGETKLMTSTLMTYLSSGNVILALTGLDATEKLGSLRRSIEKSLLEHSQKPPLLYHIGQAGSSPEFMKGSLFPKECLMISTDFWTNDPNTIHATPDKEPMRFSRYQSKVPIMTTTCHANDEPSLGGSDYILMYGKRHRISDELLVKMQQEMMLPVVVLDKSLYDTTEFPIQHASDTTRKEAFQPCPEALTKSGVKCLAPIADPVKFHTLLKGARLVIDEGVAEDHPTMLEATRCGTPVLVQNDSHEFLETKGKKPHVWLWGSTEELFDRIHKSINATSEGSHKLSSWIPESLTDGAMQTGLETLMRNTRHDCDAAMQHHS